MNQTEHYKLSQWEKADRIMMDDFNRDNASIDTALAAAAAAVAAETAARTADVAAEAAARTAAVTAETAARTADVAAEAAARTADVAALAAKSPFVKLREIVTAQSATQVNLDLSDINFADWQVLWMDVALVGSWNGTLCPNGRADAFYCMLGSSSTQSSGLTFYDCAKKYRTIFFPGKNEEKTVTCISDGDRENGIFFRGIDTELTFPQLKTFLLVPRDSGYSLRAGSKITVWGVR